MNVNDGTDTTCPTCGSGTRQSVIKLNAELAKTEAFVEVQRTELLSFAEGNAALRAENERLRAVVDAAVEWHKVISPVDKVDAALWNAVVEYLDPLPSEGDPRG